jgi:putative ABC transport system permease protein
MTTFSLAIRNLLRNRRRSLTTLLAMIVGLGAILLFGGYSRNVIYAMQTGYVQTSGHLQIQRKDYFAYGSGSPEAYGIAGYQAIIDRIENDPVLRPLLTVVTPRLQLSGIAGNFAAGVSKTVIASGVVVDQQNQMRNWDDYGAASMSLKLALTGTDANAAVAGTGVVRILQLCGPLKVPDCAQPAPIRRDGAATPADIGALSNLEGGAAPAAGATSVEILAATARGAPNVATLNLVKAENQGLKELDDVFLMMHLAQAQRLIFGAGTPQVTAIQLQLRHSADMAVARARLRELLAGSFKDAGLDILDYETLNPSYGQTIEFFDSVFGFISILIGIIVLFTVGNTMSMAVIERTVEIGTLRALGHRRSGIRRLFMAEGILLGVAGAVMGLCVALVLAIVINRSGFTWVPPGYVYAYPLQVRLWGETGLILFCAVGLVLVAVLSAWWPANRASRMMVVEALRHV